MKYICADRGTGKCPCILMETGQCYTCGMISKGKCDCLASWQGVCPYNEYMQNGSRIMGESSERGFEIKSVEDFSEKLKVITLGTTMGFAAQCGKLGSFLMVEAGGYKTPVSVMKTELAPAGCSSVKLAVYVSGPKTAALDKAAERGGKLKVTGPFSSGLINSEKFDPHRLTLIIGKGMAIMPVINHIDAIGSGLLKMYLDESKLTREFVDKYVSRLEYEKTDLNDFGESLRELKRSVENDRGYCVEHTGEQPNIFLMVSPYFKSLLINELSLNERGIITPNHANMCCGEGICGACSYTDKDGVTVRLCKCADMI